jgi:hypothetical protein
MSIFGNIKSAIWGLRAKSWSAAATPVEAPAQQMADMGTTARGQAPPRPTVASVDVEKVLTELAAQERQQKLDWRHSIVDLMKLLGLDSSLAARQKLAQELSYDGDVGDSAKMNVWLHKQVMRRLAENGGKVPDELK